MYGGVCGAQDFSEGCSAIDTKEMAVNKIMIYQRYGHENCRKGYDFALLELEKDLEVINLAASWCQTFYISIPVTILDTAKNNN
jgi:hypothetical protein